MFFLCAALSYSALQRQYFFILGRQRMQPDQRGAWPVQQRPGPCLPLPNSGFLPMHSATHRKEQVVHSKRIRPTVHVNIIYIRVMLHRSPGKVWHEWSKDGVTILFFFLIPCHIILHLLPINGSPSTSIFSCQYLSKLVCYLCCKCIGS